MTAPRSISPEQAVRNWLERVVLDLELCPFARREFQRGSIRYAVSDADTEQGLLETLAAECERLDRNPAIETTLLIATRVLQDFKAYNQFLDSVDAWLLDADREGVYQVASFHPEYRFAGTGPFDPENYTNRSPWPMLHIIREESLAAAVESWEGEHGSIGQIPERNIMRMRQMGLAELKRLLADCMIQPKKDV